MVGVISRDNRPCGRVRARSAAMLVNQDLPPRLVLVLQKQFARSRSFPPHYLDRRGQMQGRSQVDLTGDILQLHAGVVKVDIKRELTKMACEAHIDHSQGSSASTQLICTETDIKPLPSRIVLAWLLGANLHRSKAKDIDVLSSTCCSTTQQSNQGFISQSWWIETPQASAMTAR